MADPKKIMLVEDDLDLSKTYLQRLQAEGFDVKHLTNGEEALAAIEEYQPDLVILDLIMPKIQGYETLDIIKNTDGMKDIPVVIVSARSNDEDKEKALEMGATDYLVKSQVTISDIVVKLKKILEVE